MKGNNGFQILIRITTAVVILSALIASYSVYDTPSSRDMGLVLLWVSIAATALLALEYVLFRNGNKRYVTRLASMITKTEKDSLVNFPAPAIIVDENNTIVWYNKLFGRQVYTAEEAYGIDITEIVNIDMYKIFEPEGDLICLNKRFYIAK